MLFDPAIRRISRFDAHHRQLWALAVAAVVYFFTIGRIHAATQLVVVWDAYSFACLILAFIFILHADPAIVRRTVRLQDSSQTFIFILVVLAAMASFVAVGFVLGPAKDLPHSSRYLHIGLSVLAVISSWLLAHTVFALRYAHIFYGGKEDNPEEKHGGLEFPKTKDPDYLDFVYFAYVIGMTSQVSDVQITSKRLRRIALVHGVLSFGFNTIILALSINMISGLI
jgi:uncharacterized membrane protein